MARLTRSKLSAINRHMQENGIGVKAFVDTGTLCKKCKMTFCTCPLTKKEYDKIQTKWDY